MLIRRHLPNGRPNHGEITKPLIFKGLTGKYRECEQRLNYRPLYTIYTDSQSVTRSVLESRTWKQEKTNMEIRHIALRLSDLKKQNLRSQQRFKLCSCIVFISDYQCIRCSASGSNRNENRERSAFPIFLSLNIGVNRHAVFGRVSLPHLTFLATEDQHQRKYY